MTQVLQIDATYRPMGFVGKMDALKAVINGRASVVESDDVITLANGDLLESPLVIQFPKVVKLRPMKDKVIIKRVLFARDNWQCQYCGKEISMRCGEIEHVKPKDAFKKEGRPASDANTWDNVVAACRKCNGKKANKLPMECGMMPKNTPKKPDYVQTLWAGRRYKPIHARYVLQYYPKLEGEVEIAPE